MIRMFPGMPEPSIPAFCRGDRVDTLAVQNGEVSRDTEGPGEIVSREWNAGLGHLYGVRWTPDEQYPALYGEDELVLILKGQNT